MKDVSLKEIVCSVIAAAILAGTGEGLIYLFDEAGAATFKADVYQRHSQLLNVLIGMAGSVIGYYFGRVPAERLAQAAQANANDAAAQKGAAQQEANQIKKEVTSIRDSLPRPGSPVGGGAPGPVDQFAGDLRQRLDEVLLRHQ